MSVVFSFIICFGAFLLPLLIIMLFSIRKVPPDYAGVRWASEVMLSQSDPRKSRCQIT